MTEFKYFCAACGYEVKEADVICANCNSNLSQVGRKVIDNFVTLGATGTLLSRAREIRTMVPRDLKGRPMEPCIRCTFRQSSSLWDLGGFTIRYGESPPLRICEKCSDEFAERLLRFMGISRYDEHSTVPARLRWQRFRRDNFTCQKCGKDATVSDIVLRCHHLNPAKGNTIDNLITMCDFCHP